MIKFSNNLIGPLQTSSIETKSKKLNETGWIYCCTPDEADWIKKNKEKNLIKSGNWCNF